MSPFSSFEIFRTNPDGEPIWLESCTTKERAIARAREIVSFHPANYFILDRHNHVFIDAFGENPDNQKNIEVEE